MSQFTPPSSTVYGPVKSWRFGHSIGIDPILNNSTCSYSCSYCQLGKIQKQISRPQTFVTAAQIISDFKGLKNTMAKETPIDVITLSGSGEPTLAENLEEISMELTKLSPQTPQVLLTNGLHLNDPCHKGRLQSFDKIVIKIDSVEERLWRAINHPLLEASLHDSLEEIIQFSHQHQGAGVLEVQTMIYGINQKMDLKRYCQFLEKLNITTIYINAPSRKYPLAWDITHRGNHSGSYNVKTASIRPLDLIQFKNKIEKISPSLGRKIKLCPL